MDAAKACPLTLRTQDDRFAPMRGAALSHKGRGNFSENLNMTAPVSMAEAKAFLRVTHDAEDDLIALLIDAARKRVEGETGLTLTSTSPAALRLAVLMLTLRAYERGEDEMPIAPVEGWIAPYRQVRL